MKRIVLTEKGRQAHERMGERIKRFEALLREGVTDQELEWFLGLIERLQKNIR